MKKIVILIFAIALSDPGTAQFSNTSWKGQFNIPDPTEMILQFKTDTLELNYPDKTSIETMSYKISNDTLRVRKLDGQSECSSSQDATYKITLKDSKLFIIVLGDDCPERMAAWPADGMEKIEPID